MNPVAAFRWVADRAVPSPVRPEGAVPALLGLEFQAPVFLAIGAVVDLALLAGALSETRSLVALLRRDPVDVGAAPTDGTVEIEGTVRPIDPGTEATPPTERAERGDGQRLDEPTFASPVAGAESVYADVEVEKADRSGKGFDLGWSTFHEGVVARPFLVADDTGRALVDAEYADVTPAHELVRFQESPARPPDRVEHHLEFEEEPPWPAAGMTDPLLPREEYDGTSALDVKFTEARVEPGDVVHLVGRPRAPGPDDPVDHHAVELAFDSEPSWGSGNLRVTGGDEGDAVRESVFRILALVFLVVLVAGVSVGGAVSGAAP